MKHICAICGHSTKEEIVIYDWNLVTPQNNHICPDCFKLYKNYDDKALYEKIKEKILGGEK
jgi:hypothetical protein